MPFKLPRHVAIIMDGNGRWAKQRFLPVSAGHAKGALAAWDITVEASRLGIEVLTLFTFSMENWNRGEDESSDIINQVLTTATRKLPDVQRLNINARSIGDVTRVSEDLQKEVIRFREATRHNTGMNLVLALSYSGRWDIVQATNKILQQERQHQLNSPEITIEMFNDYLCLGDLPYPDLLIRTGGEQRISNFLLWQTAYSEFYFTDALWPAFDVKQFHKALKNYSKRNRRFGKRQ